jgi:hypothetical protein
MIWGFCGIDIAFFRLNGLMLMKAYVGVYILSKQDDITMTQLHLITCIYSIQEDIFILSIESTL